MTYYSLALFQKSLKTFQPWNTPRPWVCLEMRWRTSALSCLQGLSLHLKPVPPSVEYTLQLKPPPVILCGWSGPRPWPLHLYTTVTFMSRHLRVLKGKETDPKAKRRRRRKGQGGVNKNQDWWEKSRRANPKAPRPPDSRTKSHPSLTSHSPPVAQPSTVTAGHNTRTGMWPWRWPAARLYQRSSSPAKMMKTFSHRTVTCTSMTRTPWRPKASCLDWGVPVPATAPVLTPVQSQRWRTTRTSSTGRRTTLAGVWSTGGRCLWEGSVWLTAPWLRGYLVWCWWWWRLSCPGASTARSETLKSSENHRRCLMKWPRPKNETKLTE